LVINAWPCCYIVLMWWRSLWEHNCVRLLGQTTFIFGIGVYTKCNANAEIIWSYNTRQIHYILLSLFAQFTWTNKKLSFFMIDYYFGLLLNHDSLVYGGDTPANTMTVDNYGNLHLLMVYEWSTGLNSITYDNYNCLFMAYPRCFCFPATIFTQYLWIWLIS
jgi:hypothetical protein